MLLRSPARAVRPPPWPPWHLPAWQVMPCFLRSRWLLCENPAGCALAKTALGTGTAQDQSHLGNCQPALRRAFYLLGPRKELKTERALGENQKKTGPGGRSWGALGTTFHRAEERRVEAEQFFQSLAKECGGE